MKNKLEKRILEQQDISNIEPDLNKINILPQHVAEKAEAIIFDWEENKLAVLTTNKKPSILTQVLDKVTEKWYKMEFYYTDDFSFSLALNRYDELIELQEQEEKELEELKTVEGKDAIEMIKKIFRWKQRFWENEFIKEFIRLCFQSWASDVHFQPEETGVVVRIRKDWELRNILVFDHQDFRKYIMKIKHLCGVRINIDHIPQDWRFDFESYTQSWKTKKIDVRASFMPGLRGESIVMRFLDSTQSVLSFWEIWFMDNTLDSLHKNLNKNTGIILATWPTWSWKTTSLYSMLNYLNSPEKKIITLEDPVEYELPWIQQCAINEKKWFTYEEWLKSVLRQDPEVIMVWEIRTLETAEIAINAALTWHLVISTLHTNTAIEAISRLINMWVKPYMLAPALNLVIGQRLVKKLHDCHTTRQANFAEYNDVEEHIRKIKDVSLTYKDLSFNGELPNPTWCEFCWHDGYDGRIAALEAFDVDEDIKDAIIKWASTLEIYSTARQWWYLTMIEDAYIKMLKWYTTLDEIRKVI